MGYQYCDFQDVSTDPYYTFETLISAPLMLLLQLILFIHTIYQLKTHWKQVNSKTILYLYVLLQFTAIMYFIYEIFRISLIPMFIHVDKNDGLCLSIAYLDKILPLSFFGLELVLVFARLDLTFRDSVFEMKKQTKIILLLILIIPYSIVYILIFSFLSTPCYEVWEPSDIDDDKQLLQCIASFRQNPISLYSFYIGIVWYLMDNIVYGSLFSYKLRNLIDECSMKNTNDAVSKIMVKNTILTIIMAISTAVFWGVWFIANSYGNFAILLYFDMFLNCLCLGLMFKFNDKYYGILCGLCHKWFVQRNPQLPLISLVALSEESSPNNSYSNTDKTMEFEIQ